MPRNPALHDFRLLARNRVLQLIDADWSTSFKLRDPEDTAGMPYKLLLARVDGELRIIR